MWQVGENKQSEQPYWRWINPLPWGATAFGYSELKAAVINFKAWKDHYSHPAQLPAHPGCWISWSHSFLPLLPPRLRSFPPLLLVGGPSMHAGTTTDWSITMPDLCSTLPTAPQPGRQLGQILSPSVSGKESFYTWLSSGASSGSASEQHLQQQFCPWGSRSVLKHLLWKPQATVWGAVILQLSTDPNCRSEGGSIWFVSCLSWKPPGLTLVKVPTAPGIMTPSYLGSRQVEEQLRRTWLFDDISLLTSITSERGLRHTTMEVHGLETGKKMSFPWNVLPSPEQISLSIKFGHVRVDPLNQRTTGAPHLPHELTWAELQKGREGVNSSGISHSGGAGRGWAVPARQWEGCDASRNS